MAHWRWKCGQLLLLRRNRSKEDEIHQLGEILVVEIVERDVLELMERMVQLVVELVVVLIVIVQRVELVEEELNKQTHDGTHTQNTTSQRKKLLLYYQKQFQRVNGRNLCKIP
jgi:hypothetical protein